MPGHRGEDDNSFGSTITTTADARPPMAECGVDRPETEAQSGVDSGSAPQQES
jgi:hypothetical protein